MVEKLRSKLLLIVAPFSTKSRCTLDVGSYFIPRYLRIRIVFFLGNMSAEASANYFVFVFTISRQLYVEQFHVHKKNVFSTLTCGVLFFCFSVAHASYVCEINLFIVYLFS